MDSNTKIIILVLILVFIKYFIPNIDNFKSTPPPKQFLIYYPTGALYLYRIDDNNLEFTSDKQKASKFNVDSNNNLKYFNSLNSLNYFCTFYKTGLTWYIKLTTVLPSNSIKFEDKKIYINSNVNQYLNIDKIRIENEDKPHPNEYKLPSREYNFTFNPIIPTNNPKYGSIFEKILV
jgi:hypothetical protein